MQSLHPSSNFLLPTIPLHSHKMYSFLCSTHGVQPHYLHWSCCYSLFNIVLGVSHLLYTLFPKVLCTLQPHQTLLYTLLAWSLRWDSFILFIQQSPSVRFNFSFLLFLIKFLISYLLHAYISSHIESPLIWIHFCTYLFSHEFIPNPHKMKFMLPSYLDPLPSTPSQRTNFSPIVGSMPKISF